MKQYILIFLVMIVFLTGCTQKEIHNTLYPDVDEIQLISQGKIDLSEQLETIDLWAVYPKGFILISMSEKFIKAIDFEGNLIKDLYKEGEGPEEFLIPTPLFIHRERGEIEIYDASLNRSTFYDFDLNYLRTEKSDRDFCTVKKDIGNGEFQLNHSFENKEGKLIYTFKAQIIYADTIKIVKQIDMDYSHYDYGRNLIGNCNNNNIFLSLTQADKFEISVYDQEGNYQKSFTKDHKAISLNKENMEEQIKFKEQSGIDIQNWRTNPAVILMQPDYLGNLWVKTMTDVDTYIWYIFNQKGAIIAKYPTDTPRNFVKSFGDKIYRVTGDEDSGYMIEILEIDQ